MRVFGCLLIVSLLICFMEVVISVEEGSKMNMNVNVMHTEQAIEGEVDDMIWIGPNKKTVLVLTDKGVLYKSDDEGRTWNNEMPKLGATLSTTRVISMIPSPIDPTRVFFLGNGKNHWSTTTEGRQYNVHNDLPLHEVKLHPKDAKLVLASTMSKSCHDGSRGSCYKQLYVSYDFGKSWTMKTNYIVQFDWAHNLLDHQAKGLPMNAIFFTEFKTKKGNQKFGSWDRDIDFFISKDMFESKPKLLVERGNRFLFTSKYMFIAQVHRFHDNQVNLIITRDGARSFHEADLPFEMMQHSYTVLDTSEDTVFLHVNHAGEQSDWGNVYISNQFGLNYSLSLPHNRRAKNGKCDFEKMEGIEGHYLANYIDHVEPLNAFDESFGDMGVSSISGRANKAPKSPTPNPMIKSVVTFDKGGVWSYLRPPRVDANGKPTTCQSKGCMLHLHGITSEYGPFYTAENAVGLILATGNIGSQLSFRADEVNTYFSRDGGLVWHEIAKGSHIYEYGDHGALIVMAKDMEATDTLYYTWNEGLTWNMFKFTNRPMEVVNIIIEPDAVSQRFVVYGARSDSNGGYEGVLVHLDFSNLHMRSCKGLDNVGSSDSDYEFWSPSDGRIGDQCFLGHKVQYTRRKRKSQCFNGVRIEKPKQIGDCACVDLDYECDFGYKRKIQGGACVRVEAVDPSALIPKTCPLSGYYTVSDGYRRVAGDTCKGGVQHKLTQFPCGRWSSRASGAGWMVLILIILLVIMMVYVTQTQKSHYSPGFFDSIRSLISFGDGRAAGYHGIGDNLPETALDFTDPNDFDDTEEDNDVPELMGDMDNEDSTVRQRKKESLLPNLDSPLTEEGDEV